MNVLAMAAALFGDGSNAGTGDLVGVGGERRAEAVAAEALRTRVRGTSSAPFFSRETKSTPPSRRSSERSISSRTTACSSAISNSRVV
jgi:hypothetical protein